MTTMTIAFRKVSEPYGWLQNMSHHPVVHNGVEYPSSEHLFQLLRYDPAHTVWTEIPKIKSPMAAKTAMKPYYGENVVDPLSDQDFDNMKYCLVLKLDRNPALVTALMMTGDEELIEDVSKRQYGNNLIWGAALQPDGTWHGANELGRLWMEIRDDI